MGATRGGPGGAGGGACRGGVLNLGQIYISMSGISSLMHSAKQRALCMVPNSKPYA